MAQKLRFLTPVVVDHPKKERFNQSLIEHRHLVHPLHASLGQVQEHRHDDDHQPAVHLLPQGEAGITQVAGVFLHACFLAVDGICLVASDAQTNDSEEDDQESVDSLQLRLDERPARQRYSFLSGFPYVCPEPVLAK
jgi:hypothetical protein